MDEAMRAWCRGVAKHIRFRYDRAAVEEELYLHLEESRDDRFEAAARSLEQMPRRCPWLEGNYIPRGVYRYRLFAEHYMIVYQIEDDTVYADYVLDCRQDYGWLLR